MPERTDDEDNLRDISLRVLNLERALAIAVLGRAKAAEREDTGRADMLLGAISGLAGEGLHGLRQGVEHLDRQLGSLRTELHSYFAAESLGLPSGETRLYRFFPVRVFLSQERFAEVDQVSRAVERLLKEFGFDVADEYLSERGSWFKRWIARSKDLLTRPENLDRLEKLERAIELQTLHKHQASVDKSQAEAVGALLHALNGSPTAACQIGSILLLKTLEGGVIVRNLTQREMIRLEQTPQLLREPQELLEALASEKPRARRKRVSSGDSASRAALPDAPQAAPIPSHTVCGACGQPVAGGALGAGEGSERMP